MIYKETLWLILKLIKWIKISKRKSSSQTPTLTPSSNLSKALIRRRTSSVSSLNLRRLNRPMSTGPIGSNTRRAKWLELSSSISTLRQLRLRRSITTSISLMKVIGQVTLWQPPKETTQCTSLGGVERTARSTSRKLQSRSPGILRKKSGKLIDLFTWNHSSVNGKNVAGFSSNQKLSKKAWRLSPKATLLSARQSAPSRGSRRASTNPSQGRSSKRSKKRILKVRMLLWNQRPCWASPQSLSNPTVSCWSHLTNWMPWKSARL